MLSVNEDLVLDWQTSAGLKQESIQAQRQHPSPSSVPVLWSEPHRCPETHMARNAFPPGHRFVPSFRSYLTCFHPSSLPAHSTTPDRSRYNRPRSERSQLFRSGIPFSHLRIPSDISRAFLCNASRWRPRWTTTTPIRHLTLLAATTGVLVSPTDLLVRESLAYEAMKLTDNSSRHCRRQYLLLRDRTPTGKH